MSTADPGKLRILLTETASASAREILTLLARRGHTVDVLEPKRDGMTALSTAVHKRHPVPRFSDDPDGYLEALVEVLRREHYDVLLPTHEQVALLSRFGDRVRPLVGGFAVPEFDSLRVLQDKAAAVGVLDKLGVPQPNTTLVSSVDGLRDHATLPCYVKLPISTASAGVWRVNERAELDRVAGLEQIADTFRRGWPVLVQEPVEGPIAMAQTVFEHGRLVAAHAAYRTRDGVRGSASAKERAELPELIANLERLGEFLRWHGGLSVDAVVDEANGGTVIDINPRLVEPVSSELAGTDLLGRMLAVSLGEQVGDPPAGRTGSVRTHMLLMALLRHGEVGNGRGAVAKELWQACTGRGWYTGSTEELLPIRWDAAAALPVSAVAVRMLCAPASWRTFVDGASPGHTVTPDVWEWLTRGS